MGARIVNPQTGEVMELQNGRWVSVGNSAVTAQAAGSPAPTVGPIADSALEAALVGAGDTFTTWGRNVRDAYAGITGDRAAQLAIEDERTEADKIRAQLFAEHPVAATIGSALPGVIATLPLGGIGAGMAGAAGLAARTGVNLATGATLGALGSTTGELGAGAAEGGLFAGAGQLAGNMVARVNAARAGIRETQAAQAAARMRAMVAAGDEAAAAGAAGTEAGIVGPGGPAAALDDAQRAIVQGAQRAGLKVTPGQLLNDPNMRQMEASFASNPVLSPYWQEMKQANAQQINTLAARAMGVDADNVGAAVRAQAEHQIGREFDQIGQDIGLVNTAPLKKALAEIADEEKTSLLPRVEIDSILTRFERGATARAGATAGEGPDLVTGQALMRERSRIAGQMRDAYQRGDSTLGNLYGDVVDAMDEAVKTSARNNLGSAADGRAVAQAYDAARDKWAVLRAMERGGSTIDGQVLPGQAARILGRSDKSRFWGRADEVGQTMQRTGTGTLGEDRVGDLYDALRFASSQLGKDIVGDSGTATRMASSGIFEGGIPAMVTRAGAYAARRAIAGPLATRYMNMSPESAQAFNAALQRSALAGWQAGGGVGAAAGIGAGTMANELGQALE